MQDILLKSQVVLSEGLAVSPLTTISLQLHVAAEVLPTVGVDSISLYLFESLALSQ